jgi:hypothetical protein
VSGVLQNIDPPPPSPPGECAFGAGMTRSPGGEGGGGSIFWKMPDTALYSTYISTLCFGRFLAKLGLFAGFSLYAIHFTGKNSEAAMGREHYFFSLHGK